MTLNDFFEKFDLISDTPNAISRMRALVLRLAVRGKLVPQNSADGDADHLLRDIASRRSRRIEEISPDNYWHEIPNSWCWVRLGSIGEIVGGGTPRSDNPAYFSDTQGIPWLTPADLNGFAEKRIFRGRRFITPQGFAESSTQLLPEGSVLFSSRAPIGYVAIAGSELATNQGFKTCVPFVEETNEYLYYYLMNAAARIDSEAPGTTFREVSGKLVSQIPVALPPLAEQKRIVAKVDELMALCDRLEAQEKERNKRHAALARASLSRFSGAPNPANLTFLFHKSYNIPAADLRKAILVLAVGGKLVPQCDNDETAEAILKRLAETKQDVAKDSNGNVPMSLGRIRELEKPWQLPVSWEWVRLGDIANIKHGFAFSGESFTSEPSAFVLTTPGNFYERGGFRDRGPRTKYYRGEVDPSFVFKPGDLIVPMTEQAAGLLGSPALIPDDGKAYLHNQRLGKLCFYSNAILPKFVYWYFNSEFFRSELARTCTGMKVRHTSPRKILNVPYPLCSLSEQSRIVAKVDQLMAFVDALESQLAASRGIGAILLDAIVAALTDVSTGGTQ